MQLLQAATNLAEAGPGNEGSNLTVELAEQQLAASDWELQAVRVQFGRSLVEQVDRFDTAGLVAGLARSLAWLLACLLAFACLTDTCAAGPVGRAAACSCAAKHADRDPRSSQSLASCRVLGSIRSACTTGARSQAAVCAAGKACCI